MKRLHKNLAYTLLISLLIVGTQSIQAAAQEYLYPEQVGIFSEMRQKITSGEIEIGPLHLLQQFRGVDIELRVRPTRPQLKDPIIAMTLAYMFVEELNIPFTPDVLSLAKEIRHKAQSIENDIEGRENFINLLQLFLDEMPWPKRKRLLMLRKRLKQAWEAKMDAKEAAEAAALEAQGGAGGAASAGAAGWTAASEGPDESSTI